MQLYNVQVGVFNAAMNVYSIKAQVFKTNIDAKLALLDAYRIQLDGQKVIGEINAQAVQSYNVAVQAVGAQTEIYKAQMSGAQVQAQIITSQIEVYRTDVQAYAEKLGAQKVAFDAYKTQVEGEVAKAGILDVDARVFTALVAAESTRADTYFKGVDAKIAVFRANNDQYGLQLERTKTELQAKLAKVQARAQVEGLNIQYLSVQNDANRAKAEAEIRIIEQQLQGNIAAANAAIKQYEVLMTKGIQEADLKSRALQAAGQMTATLAGGAMAAQHVSAQISGSGTDSLSAQYTFGAHAQENWTYEGTA